MEKLKRLNLILEPTVVSANFNGVTLQATFQVRQKDLDVISFFLISSSSSWCTTSVGLTPIRLGFTYRQYATTMAEEKV